MAKRNQEKCRLLIIEDDTALAALLEEYMNESSDYEIQVVNNGDAAIDLLSREHFDVILSDIMLPGANGMTILKTVGGDFARTIVVLMTGYSGIDDALSAIKKGAYDFVSKPFQLSEIKIRLDNASNYQKLLRQLQELQDDGSLEPSDHKDGRAAMKIYSLSQAGVR